MKKDFPKIFKLASTVGLSGEVESKNKSFSGEAYSGNVIYGHYMWGNLVFDCSTTESAASIPALVEHESSRIAGHTESVTFNNNIAVAGKISNVTEDAQRIAALSAEGFPWQMSVHIEPSIIEELQPGAVAFVNGQSISGPVTIFRNNVIREVSFVALGADKDTSAYVFSFEKSNKQKEKVLEMTTEIKPEIVDTRDEQIAALNARLSAFESDAKNVRVEQVKALFSARGEEYDEAMGAPFVSMSKDQFQAAQKFASQVAKIDTRLTEEQAVTTSNVSTEKEIGSLLMNAKKRAGK